MFGMQTSHLGSAAKHWKLAGWTYAWPKAQKVKEGFLMTFTSVLPGCSFQASGGKKSKILDLHSIIHLTLLFLFCCSICVFNVPSHTNTSTVPNFLHFFPTWVEFPIYHASGETDSPIHSFQKNPSEFIYKETMM